MTEVIPGLIKTDMTEKARRDGIPPEKLAIEILANMNRDRIVLEGAKFPWAINQFCPKLVQKKILEGS